MLELAKLKQVYVIGIKGSGVIAIVEILHSLGIAVTGSDTPEKFFTDEILQKLGIKYREKFAAENLPDDVGLVVYSTAYNEANNTEFAEAKKRNLPMLSYPEILGELFNQKYGLAVCGTHGKTTTSSLLADVLKKAGTDPSAVIGSRVKEWGGNALIGQGDYFVIEADEYQNKLSLYQPKGAILTSVDWDHPDFFKTVADYKQVFSDFAAKIPPAGFLVVWGDSVSTLEVAKAAHCQVVKYGFGEDNDVRIANYELKITDGPATQSFDISCGDRDLGNFKLQLVGRHNVLNAAAVIAVCDKLNVDMEKVRQAIGEFQGTSRRFEYIGRHSGAILIDDYGHHPEEVKATLSGAREIYPDKNIIAVFHPHTFTRTKALLQEFSQSFADADRVIVLDIYGSAREVQGGVSSQELVELINKYDRGKAEHVPTIAEAVKYLQDKIGEQDIVLCIGAGNVFEVAEKLKQSE